MLVFFGGIYLYPPTIVRGRRRADLRHAEPQYFLGFRSAATAATVSHRAINAISNVALVHGQIKRQVTTVIRQIRPTIQTNSPSGDFGLPGPDCAVGVSVVTSAL